MKITDLQIIEACNKSVSMYQAAVYLSINYKTLISRAKKIGCYKPNQSGKGCRKKPNKLYELQEILKGSHPDYSTSRLKRRLILSGVKKHVCENCNLSIWLEKPIPLELHHKDGNRYNHKFENLEILCPNCHSFTDNYRSKNIKNRRVG